MINFLKILPNNFFAVFTFLFCIGKIIKITKEKDLVNYIKVVCKNDCFLFKVSKFFTKCDIAAVTAGSFVFFRDRYKTNKKIIKHEQIHIQQQIKWSILFVFIYLYDYVIIKIRKNGDPYRDNRFEKEAYEKSELFT